AAAAGVAGAAPPPGAATLARGRPIRRILLMQLKWMGDVLMCTPAIRAVRRAYPEATIDFATGVEGAAVLEGNPHLDEVLVWRRGRAGLAMLWQIARRHYDAVVDFRSTPRDAWYVLASRARIRAGMRGRGPRTLAYTHLFEWGQGPRYMAARKLEPLRALGIEPPASPEAALELVTSERERAWARETLARHALAGGPIVAVSPVTRVHYKQWGAEKWAAVADALAGAGARVLITSGPGELEQARAVAQRMKHHAVFDYGRTSIRQLAALYEHCALWVGNDGGAKHIAVAVGTPTVTVFRHREGEVWTDGSASSPHLAIEREPVLPCIYPHCGGCKHLSCLEQLAAGDVVALALRAFAEAVQPGPAPGPATGPSDAAPPGSRGSAGTPAAAASPAGDAR
ncbi:MAG TPA: glycosyltransferase family 9 protein, partial [Longimicrobiales bacterium]